MSDQVASVFFSEVSKRFSFLVDEFGFCLPLLEIDETINFAFAVFLGKNLSIEFILDERESDVTCKIGRVINGKRTDRYEVDDQGELVRDYLSNMLRRRGIPTGFTSVKGLSLLQMIPVTLTDFERLLRKYGSDILADSPTALRP